MINLQNAMTGEIRFVLGLYPVAMIFQIYMRREVLNGRLVSVTERFRGMDKHKLKKKLTRP